MKKLIILVISILITFTSNVNAQMVGKPGKTYCLGNPEHEFLKVISPDFRTKLDSLFSINNIDTSVCRLLTYNDWFDYANSKTIRRLKYKWFSITKENGKIIENMSERDFEKFDKNVEHKLLVIYTTIDESDMEKLQVYYFN